MRPETAAALQDMSRAVERIAEASAGKSFDDYAADWLLQSAVERQFEILGEALGRIRGFERPVFERFPDADKIVGLRNILIHGYDAVDPAILWSIVQDRLAGLRSLLGELLDEANRQGL